MRHLTALYLRWCSQVRDFGLQHLCGMANLQVLSLAGKWSTRNTVTINSQVCNNFRLSIADFERSFKSDPTTAFAGTRTDELSWCFSRAIWISKRTPAVLPSYRVKPYHLCPLVKWYFIKKKIARAIKHSFPLGIFDKYHFSLRVMIGLRSSDLCVQCDVFVWRSCCFLWCT